MTEISLWERVVFVAASGGFCLSLRLFGEWNRLAMWWHGRVHVSRGV